MSLATKGIHELRTIAFNLKVPDVFNLTRDRLIHQIELKRVAEAKPEPVRIEPPAYDARLMTKPPSKKATKAEVEELLREHMARGLIFRVDENEETWQMWCGKKLDTGSMRMPLRVILLCADRVISE
jgi:hypothetical protein